MSLDALVAEAGRALGSARGLFGAQPMQGSWGTSSGELAAGRDGVAAAGGAAEQSWSGAGAASYVPKAGGAVAALDSVTGADEGTAAAVAGGGQSATQGRGGMNTVIDSARSGVAAIAPLTDTQAGRVHLVNRLQGELDRAKALLQVSEQRNVALASLIRSRSAGYGAARPSMSGGGMPTTSATSTPTLGGLGIPNIANFIRRGGPQDHQDVDQRAAVIDGQCHPAAAQAVKFALSKLGSPYVWGAKGPNAFDCSGLVHWAYAQAGVTLGNDTYALINEGAPVAPGHVTAGDTIFPSSSFGEGGKRGPGHVMLAINDHQCVEAQQTGVPVKVSPMPRDYVARRPMSA